MVIHNKQKQRLNLGRSGKPNTRFSDGFTIVEAIIAVGITVILTSSLIVYSRESEKQVVFFREESVLTGVLLRAKSSAIETFQPSFLPSPGSAPVDSAPEKICGWGVHFDQSKHEYILFKDLLMPNGRCDDQNPQYENSGGISEDFEKFTLDPRVEISCLQLNTSFNLSCVPGTGTNNIDILFVPPEPRVFFHPDPTAVEAVVKLKIIGSNRTATLSVTKSGQVNVTTP